MKNDVDEYLKGKKKKVEDLNDVLQNMYNVYAEVKELHEKRKDTGEHKLQLEKIGGNFIKRFEADYPEEKQKPSSTKKTTAKKKDTATGSVKDKPEAKKKTSRKSKEQQVIDKTPGVITDLSACKKLIREDRKRRIKIGEIKAPTTQTTYTKLKNAFVRILKVLPAEKTEYILATKKTLSSSLKKIFDLHGWKKSDVIDRILDKIADEQIKKLKNA